MGEMIEEVIALEEEAEVCEALEMLSMATSDSATPSSSSTASSVTLQDDSVGEFYIPELTFDSEESEEEMNDDGVDYD